MKLAQVIASLDRMHGPPPPPPCKDPLELVLWETVAYLLDDTKRRAAFEALRARVGLTAGGIAAASDAALHEVARLGGMHAEQRVDRFREVAQIALQLGDLTALARGPFKQAVKAFKRFPGLGEPGAGKILLFSGYHAVLALESNGLRVLVRLGLAEESKSYAATYRAVREALQPLPGDTGALIHAHQQLRRHGQEVCRRNQPHCDACVLRKHCAHAIAVTK